MIRHLLFRFSVAIFLLSLSAKALAWENMPMPRLHVEGKYLKDTQGNIVNLHGFAQTFSPWFNEQGKYWTNYNVSGCLTYNKGIIDKVLAAGWKINFVRMHMDPYWSNIPGMSVQGENDISAFSFTRFKAYLNSVFIPMAQYATSKGLYVVMRPPGVCPKDIAVGDAYNQYLIKVWGYVAQQPALRNNPNILFELANEPINIKKADGTQGGFKELKDFFQAVVDTMRVNCDNILLVPGLGYQSQYQGFVEYPVEGENIGYAVHVYPGWFNSGSGYAAFQSGWDAQVQPVANFAPVVVTEMDWAPAKYNCSWGKAETGVAGGEGFGANFKKITDAAGNVSWLIFTGPDWMAKYTNIPPAEGDTATFLNDPEACPWPTFHWYEEYATQDYPHPDFTQQSCSDNGNGTFTNPVIHADFPDPDVERVGDTYYFVSTTMHQFPGATILKSKDLVNWSYCCNPLTQIASSDAYNLLNGENRYSAGQWASALKYHNGKFYLLFNTNHEGGFLLTATDPEGEWTMTHLSRGYYDCGVLFDTDGKIYVVSGINHLSITQVDENFEPIKEQTVVVRDDAGLEGSHLYHIGNYYYIYSTYGGGDASQTVFRSTNIFGPYEEGTVFKDSRIHQGALIETQTGEWWTLMFQDCGAYGRLPNLQPITWTDGWPIIGVNGKGVTTHKKPNVGRDYAPTVLPTNDNFRNYKLSMQWQWNHNPDNAKWSLMEQPGWLRLHTATVTTDLKQARNTLTQRIFGYHSSAKNSYGTICLNVKQMADGDMAGLCIFQDPYAYIAVSMENGQKTLKMYSSAGDAASQTLVCDSLVYLRAVANYGSSTAKFYFSTDNQNYSQLGGTFDMKYNLSVFVGNRFAIFNYATKQLGGYVDVDWFSTEPSFAEDTYYDDSFTGYTEAQLTMDSLYVEHENLRLLAGSASTYKLTARYADGHTEDVTAMATYANSGADIITLKNGQIITAGVGEADVMATYTDLLGHTLNAPFKVSVELFPLAADLLNPNIYSTGSFNEATTTLITGQYGFGGWQYDKGIDLSAYKYIVVELKQPNTGGASFRIFDQNNYWGGAAMYDMGNKTRVLVPLDQMKHADGTACDPSHLYIIGFWSYGGSPIVIKDIYLSNDGITNGIVSAEADEDANELVDVYSVSGVLMRRQVPRAKASEGLPKGIYIIKNKVFMVSK